MKTRRVLIIFSILIGLSQLMFGQSLQIKHANDLYSKGQYANAAQEYKVIIKRYGVSPELYFNLGNAYYKCDSIGKSILNYKRALRLDPGFEDASYNLQMAQQKVVDNIQEVQSFFVKRWVENLIKLLTSDSWFYISFVVFIIGLINILIFVFGQSVVYRKISFYLVIVLFGTSLVTGIFSGIRKNQVTHHKEAVIMSGTITVKGSPDQSGTELFQLHEGTIVKIKSSLGNWDEILVGNGDIGWVEDADIERI